MSATKTPTIGFRFDAELYELFGRKAAELYGETRSSLITKAMAEYASRMGWKFKRYPIEGETEKESTK